MVSVSFSSINRVLSGNIEGHLFDAVWADVSDKCCIAFNNQHQQYSATVMSTKKAKRKGPRAPAQDAKEDNQDGLDDGAGAAS